MRLLTLTFQNASTTTFLTIFGGRVGDIESFLIDERLPEGWESRVTAQMGLTMFRLNLTSLPLEFSTNEKKYRATLESQSEA